MLEISTGNISIDTKTWLSKQQDICDIVVYKKEEYGWFIPLYEEINKECIPNDLKKIIEHAEKNNLEWVMFDRDVEETDMFEIFD
ncbi:hypothetical protein RVS70_05445 [Virgibacillus sp. M23]|uniref:DUF5983 family protein n=1 Tax=Virgibacillus sp. M23 TaxID=3079030 RepID=UPI002A9171B8|nr:hypothetical protein [Virgibacillus sp. M23]MDY7043646.1 hypothetical protein [Virgibacillus sp. M23]